MGADFHFFLLLLQHQPTRDRHGHQGIVFRHRRHAGQFQDPPHPRIDRPCAPRGQGARHTGVHLHGKTDGHHHQPGADCATHRRLHHHQRGLLHGGRPRNLLQRDGPPRHRYAHRRCRCPRLSCDSGGRTPACGTQCQAHRATDLRRRTGRDQHRLRRDAGRPG